MKVMGDMQPGVSFSVEAIPNRPGFSMARFYENVRPYEEIGTDGTYSGWQWDEYHLSLRNIGNLNSDIDSNFELFLKYAKLADRDLSNEALYRRADSTDSALADADELLIDQEMRLIFLELGLNE